MNFDSTENVYIEGDNFEVLKILQESYLGKIKMIYIDPPYNTGKDFIYKDNFTAKKATYEEELGTTDEEDNKLFKNTDTNGRFHSDWLSMMYERLIIARDLLKEDGVIFISIANQEIDNLIKVSNEIFGEENFLGLLIWRKKEGGGMADDYFATEHEYILIYQKTGAFIWNDEILIADENDFNKEDAIGKYNRVKLAKWGNTARREDRPSMYYPIIDPEGNENFPFSPDGSDGRWRIGVDLMNDLIKNNFIEFIKKENAWIPYEKIYFDPSKGKVKKLRSILYTIGGTARGTNEITRLFKRKDIFDNPKPITLFKSFAKYNTLNKDIILDFFSGSATTAHAVMQLNAEDNGNRKFIMVQLPEATDEKSEAYKAGYKTIAEIGKERIRRAGTKIVEDNQDKAGIDKLDIGFRVYKTGSSNMEEVYYHPEQLSQDNLFSLASNIKEERTPDDLLTQVILD
ncbi:site-specific DNA-methyltransferase, partial [Bathymodiolus platifrons methanotrophic gill symbiont]|uniref:site-specific DNA-methyltransferase n=1 Tax=Bathymodiolus platifrons methanotrophic gill symbiont TaxID=113268 RepID=UPI001124D02A